MAGFWPGGKVFITVVYKQLIAWYNGTNSRNQEVEHQMTLDIKTGDKVRLTVGYLRKHAARQDTEYTVTSVVRHVAPNGNGAIRTQYQIHDESLGDRAGYYTCARGSLKMVPTPAAE